MDTYFPKTRRPITNSAIKRPPPSVTPPKPAKIPATPTTPKDARIPRPLRPPPVVKRRLQLDDASLQETNRRRPVSVRELFKSVHPPKEAAVVGIATEKSDLPIRTAEKKRLEEKQEVEQEKEVEVQRKQHTTPTKPPVETSGPLKGISTSLLDLIRAKEAAKVSPETDHRNKLLGIAPEVVRIVFTVFTANKKEIMLHDRVVDKCFKGLKSNYTTETIRDCLTLVDKAAPEWVSVVQISKGRFMRINRDNYTIPQLLEAIRRYKKQNC